MKLSIFTTVSDPIFRGDNWEDAINCYMDLADELVVVRGGWEGIDPVGNINVTHIWPKEFSWEFIGEQFQRGYEAATGDWVIHCDLDYIFHENDFGKIRQALKDYPNSPAVSFYKWQFIQPDRYNLKSRLVIAVNKAKYGERIKFNGGGDLCQPTLDGKELNINELPQAGVPFYNYEKLTKTKEQIIDDVKRMERAYQRRFDRALYTRHHEKPFDGWMAMVLGRASKPAMQIKLSDHPKYVQKTIKNLKPNQFGYDGFGNFERNNYA